MKILVVGDFDPSGVHLRHRKYLRELGVDYRLAVREAYRKEGQEADCCLERRGGQRKSEYADIRWFAAQADIIQFLPVIGQPWSFQELEPRLGNDADDIQFGGIDWSDPEFSRARRVVCFHGSRNALANRKRYSEFYRGRGYSILATTIDYSCEMSGEYLPSIVDIEHDPRLREDGEPLGVIHSPTDPDICSTDEFLRVCRELNIPVTYMTGRLHENVLTHKRHHHCGYDHLRGAFSVNSLENVAFGMVNLVGVLPCYRAWLEDRLSVRLPWPEAETMEDVAYWLERLRDDPRETRTWQTKAIDWYRTEWSPQKNARRILNVYERILAS